MRSKAVLLAPAILAFLSIAGCANEGGAVGDTATKQVASSDQSKEDEVYCQTDDSTGSRLQRHTTCNSANNADAQQAARGFQNGGYISPPGH